MSIDETVTEEHAGGKFRAFFNAHSLHKSIHHACHKTIACASCVDHVCFEERHVYKLAVLIAIRAVFTATQIDCVYPPLRDFLACVESGLLVRYLHARQNFRFILVWFYTTDIFDFVVCDSRLFCRNGVEKNRYGDVCNQKIKTIGNIRVRDDACRAVDNVEIFCPKTPG